MFSLTSWFRGRADLERRLEAAEAEHRRVMAGYRGLADFRLDGVGIQAEQSAASVSPPIHLVVDQAGVHIAEDNSKCRWCGHPAVDLVHQECELCGRLRPADDEVDEDVVFACERCGRIPADADSGLCGKCAGKGVSR